jgi:3-dehydroquinate dehydratase I
LAADPSAIAGACDLVEIRLDLLCGGGQTPAVGDWELFSNIPLLFTARRIEEGGALTLSAGERMALLETALADAAVVDIEVASIDEMGPILDEIRRLGIPWVASYHDFQKLPTDSALESAAALAKEAGATVFKAAAKLSCPADLARLAEFQLIDRGILTATMGMGPLAPVSRLLCAQSGSVLNYGYLGKTPTAPGQWDSALLKTAITRLTPFRI